MKKTRITFANREIEFIDREIAIKQIEELTEKGTRFPIVIYGPEGCGKTALFRQIFEILKEHNYATIHVNPLAETIEEKLSINKELKNLTRELGTYLAGDTFRLIEKIIELLYTAVKKGMSKRIAILADDIFQATGLDKAELLVKSLLNMIEWPSVRYEKIIILASSSEGITMEKIGRHNWAILRLMWNMSRDEFKQLYNVLPDPKPLFNDIWRLTGGNPRILERLYRSNWKAEEVIEDLLEDKKLIEFVNSLNSTERELLKLALEDPDILLKRYRETKPLVEQLIEKNLAMRIRARNHGWIDIPPPENDLEIGTGKYYAWQTPIHREAVKKALEATKTS